MFSIEHIESITIGTNFLSISRYGKLGYKFSMENDQLIISQLGFEVKRITILGFDHEDRRWWMKFFKIRCFVYNCTEGGEKTLLFVSKKYNK